jgi:hypothetical protein
MSEWMASATFHRCIHLSTVTKRPPRQESESHAAARGSLGRSSAEAGASALDDPRCSTRQSVAPTPAITQSLFAN